MVVWAPYMHILSNIGLVSGTEFFGNMNSVHSGILWLGLRVCCVCII